MKKKLSALIILILLALSLPSFAGTKRKTPKQAKATHSRKYQKKHSSEPDDGET